MDIGKAIAGLSREELLAKIKSAPLAKQLSLLNALKKSPSSAESIKKDVSRETPKDFILGVLGEKPSDTARAYGYDVPWTPDQGKLYDAIAEGATRIAVHSGHGCGKSAAAARIAIWGLFQSENTTVITTAPTKRQVETVLWSQIRDVYRSSLVKLPGRLLKTRIDVNDMQFAFGFTAAVGNEDLAATKAQGLHAKNRTIIIVDEASGVDDLILESLKSLVLREDDIILLIGNPTAIGSAYHKYCREWDEVFKFSCLDHPNVLKDNQDIIPGAVTRKWCEDTKADYGENSPSYQAKVLGEWPEQSSETLITLGWYSAAQARYNASVAEKKDTQVSEAGVAAGLDIAGTGGDLTVLSIIEDWAWKIPRIKGKPAWHVGRDVMQAVQLVTDAYDDGIPIRILVVDDTGLGQGPTARIRQLQNEGKLPRFAVIGRKSTQRPWILPFNFQQSAFRKTRFSRMKDELWWNAREQFRLGNVLIPSDDDIAGFGLPRGQSFEKQITSPIFTTNNSGQTVVLDKRDSSGNRIDERVRAQIKHLPDGSPDIAHSFILALWGWVMVLLNAPKMDKRVASQNPEEIFDSQVRQMINKGMKKKARGPMPPWMR
jgi:phage terminase large subunit